MKKFGAILVIFFLIVVLFFVSIRFQDGPMGPFAGGPLEAGAWTSSEGTDFSYVSDISTIELQLLDPPRSRTVWVIYHEGDLYVPCGFIDLPIWKQWPHEAMANGEAVARIDGKRFPFELERVEDPTLWSKISALAAAKYDLPVEPSDTSQMDTLWIFRMNDEQS